MGFRTGILAQKLIDDFYSSRCKLKTRRMSYTKLSTCIYSEQNGTCGGVNFDPLSLTVPVFSTVLDIMEIAARMGQSYQFVITFTAMLHTLWML